MKKTVGTFIVLFATGLVIGGAWAQPLPTAKPEQVGMSSERLARLGPALKTQIANDRFPGAVMLVARKGKVVYFEAVGQRDPATGAPMTKDAIFRLYSMTKPFTSVAAMILVEEGRLLLADPVSKYFLELANPQVALMETTDGKTTYRLVPAERRITIQDLLRHTSGFVYSNNTLNEQVKAAYGATGVGWQDVTPAEQIRRLAQVPLAHHPGTPAIALLQPGYGFGLGFAVRKETGVNSVPGSAGEYNWGGAAGTGFWIDPKEALICVVMTQTVPGPAQRYDRALVRQLVYQAIIE